MKQKHTPGPWKITRYAALHVETEGHRGICSCGYTNSTKDIDDENKANARLIAAAPDMLAALQDVAKSYQQLFDVMPVAWQTLDDIVTAAIAKATGE